MVATRLNRSSLTTVQLTTLPAVLSESRERENFLLQRVVDGDREGFVPIHLSHLTEKVGPVIRPPLQTVVLPLMNHFVREGIHDFLSAIFARVGGLVEQGKRKANLACGWRAKTFLIQPRSWPSRTGEQADGGSEPAAPDEIDWW